MSTTINTSKAPFVVLSAIIVVFFLTVILTSASKWHSHKEFAVIEGELGRLAKQFDSNIDSIKYVSGGNAIDIKTLKAWKEGTQKTLDGLKGTGSEVAKLKQIVLEQGKKLDQLMALIQANMRLDVEQGKVVVQNQNRINEINEMYQAASEFWKKMYEAECYMARDSKNKKAIEILQSLNTKTASSYDSR